VGADRGLGWAGRTSVRHRIGEFAIRRTHLGGKLSNAENIAIGLIAETGRSMLRPVGRKTNGFALG